MVRLARLSVVENASSSVADLDALIAAERRRRFRAHGEDELRVLRKLIFSRELDVGLVALGGELHALAEQVHAGAGRVHDDVDV